MQHCGKCHRATRQDENLTTASIPEWGIGAVCAPCLAEATEQPYHPRTYPVGSSIPQHPIKGGDVLICGVCRKALHWDDAWKPMRLHADDLVGTEIEPGLYASCRECVEHFKPLILARLLKDPEMPRWTMASFPGNALV